MTLVADGGSTKVDWIAFDEQKRRLFEVRTKGLNPAVLSVSVLKERIVENKPLRDVFTKVKKVYFYGAGCGTKEAVQRLQMLFEQIFINAKISVQEDILAAVYACGGAPSIVAILGTGSNSCYFDGKNIHSNSISLGYMVMDEASGNYFGKKIAEGLLLSFYAKEYC